MVIYINLKLRNNIFKILFMDANTVLDGINRIGAGITGFSGFFGSI